MKSKKLLKNMILVSSISLLTKFLGFFREILIARMYGASWITDAFFLSQNMPGLIFPSVCDSFATSFISINAGIKSWGKKKIFLIKSSVFLFGLGLILTLVSLLILPIIIRILGPGFDRQTLDLSIYLSRISMSYFVVLILNTLLIAYLNALEKFYLSQISWIFYNIVLLAVIMGYSSRNIVYLSFCYFVSNIFQMFFLLYMTSFFKNMMIFRKKVKEILKDKNIKKMWKLTIPILIGNSVYQLQNIVDKMIVSYGVSGNLSELSYSISINNITIGLVIGSLVTVIYPMLAIHIAECNSNALREKLTLGLDILALLVIPISFFVYKYNFEIVNAIYKSHKFTYEGLQNISLFLKYYSISYIFIGIKEIFIKLFYAKQNSKIPMYNSIISVFFNIFFSLCLVKKIGVYGVALGTSISSIISTLILGYFVKRFIEKINFKKLNFLKISICILISDLCLQKLINPFEINFMCVLLKSIIFLVVYILMMFILGYSFLGEYRKKVLSLLKEKN